MDYAVAKMEIVPTNFTVADYCAALDRNEIQVNSEYQRSDMVWPTPARSFLIESILLGYPVPKVSLFQRIDVKSKRTYKEIVDGQQRSRAIVDFYHDRLVLSRTLETSGLAGATYSTLPDVYQERFLNYPLSADVFVGANVDTIREVFRRMNSYTVPLNPEEERHATYQGEFKWFIYRLSKEYDEVLSRMGVFGEKQFVRMADAKLLAEVSHAMLYGISTTDKKKLRALYKDYDRAFPMQEELEGRFTAAFKQLSKWTDLHHTELARHYMIYSLILAVAHVLKPVDALEEYYPLKKARKIKVDTAVANLLILAEAAGSGDEGGPLGTFVAAASSRTNVGSQRATRFVAFCDALLDSM